MRKGDLWFTGYLPLAFEIPSSTELTLEYFVYDQGNLRLRQSSQEEKRSCETTIIGINAIVLNHL